MYCGRTHKYNLVDRQGTTIYTGVTLQSCKNVARSTYEDPDETHNPSVSGKPGFNNDHRLFANSFGSFNSL